MNCFSDRTGTKELRYHLLIIPRRRHFNTACVNMHTFFSFFSVEHHEAWFPLGAIYQLFLTLMNG